MLQKRTTTAIEIRELFYHRKGSSILKNVNLKIHKNDFVVLIGPNGGGKTTLIKLILNLIQPTKGKIKIFGELLDHRNHDVSYVPQEMNTNRNFPITVMDVVLMGYKKKFWNFKKSKANKKALNAMEKMEILQYRNRRIGELSGGQQQRALIARAIITKPKLLLMDEPTANIDTNGQTNFYKLLKKINKTTTIILASHDLMVLSAYAKSVVCVNQSVYFHPYSEINTEIITKTYGSKIELLTHSSIPHRILSEHS